VHTRTASCGNGSVLNSNRQLNVIGTTSNDNSQTKQHPHNEEGQHMLVTKNMDLSRQQ
jgi:hypothetical protein